MLGRDAANVSSIARENFNNGTSAHDTVLKAESSPSNLA